MATLFTIITLAIVIAGAVLVAWVLFEMSPFAHHADQFRDRSGRRRGESPHL